ncbi:MAG: hypothetical protein ACRC26_09455, partial [Bacteroidales bacterium]
MNKPNRCNLKKELSGTDPISSFFLFSHLSYRFLLSAKHIFIFDVMKIEESYFKNYKSKQHEYYTLIYRI